MVSKEISGMLWSSDSTGGGCRRSECFRVLVINTVTSITCSGNSHNAMTSFYTWLTHDVLHIGH